MRELGAFVAGAWVPAQAHDEVRDKYTGAVVGRVGVATPDLLERAVAAADHAFRHVPFPPEDRARALARAAALLGAQKDRFVELHTAETGFTLADSEADWTRAVRTLEICAEEVKRIAGEMVPLDWYPGAAGKLAFTLYEPVGPVCAITPFNSPLNTVVHKVGPALAAGNPVVLKPAVATPLSGAALAELLTEAGVPDGYVNVVFGGPEVGDALLADQRFGFYAFTGSTAVGRHIAASIGLRRSQLELGSIAATIVCADGDPKLAAEQVRYAGFRKSGQVCTSVQRLLVHRDVLSDVSAELVSRAETLIAGDPRDPATDLGPLVSEAAAVRAHASVNEALAAGARALCGAERDGALLRPTILTGVDPDMRVMREEIFAPVVSIVAFDDLDAAIALANATPFGLAAGVFTQSLETARAAMRRLRVGTVQINAASSNRFDSMLFGGVRDSGFGKEGPRYAIRAMSDERLVVVN